MNKKSQKPLLERFDSVEDKVYDYLVSRKGAYYSSSSFQRLKDRMSTLDMSINMAWKSSDVSNAWKSKVCMPLVREKYLMLKGMTLASFRQLPIVTVMPEGNTSSQQAELAQVVLNQMLRRSQFMSRAWRDTVEYASRYGTAVVVSEYLSTTANNNAKKTWPGPLGITRMNMSDIEGMKTQHKIVNKCIDPRNYFQNQDVSHEYDAPTRGYIENITLSRLISEIRENSDAYVKKNVKEIIEEAKKATSTDPDFYHNGNITDWERVGIDRSVYYSTLPIEGNEDDDITYRVEIIGEKIARIEENPWDENIVPISIFRFLPRLNHWWANTPIENSMPMENFLNTTLQLQADRALKELEKFIFYDRSSGINMADLQNKKIGGVGMVPFDGKNRPASEVFFEWQPKMSSSHLIQPIIDQVKEADQRVSFMNDFMRSATQGGPQNDTATAAVMMNEQGNVLKSDLLESISYGLIEMCKNNLIMAQEVLPDQFMLRPERGAPILVNKEDFLGQYEYYGQASITQNQATRQMQLLNFMTALMNFRGSGDPSFMNVNLPNVMREWIKTYNLPMDIDEIINPQPTMPMIEPGIGPAPAMTPLPTQSGPGPMPQMQAQRQPMQPVMQGVR